jgi:hypothetical protein
VQYRGENGCKSGDEAGYEKAGYM